jgi:hypothetical protein
MAALDTARWIALTYVKPDRREEFEAFLREVVVPAERKVRPHAVGRWQALRPAEEGDDAAIYALMFYGEQPIEYWDLDAILREAYGPDEASHRIADLDDLMTGEQQVLAFSGDVMSS